MEKQKIELNIGDSPNFRTKWEVGLKVIGKYFRVYWKLTHAKGFGNSLQAILKREWCDSNGAPLKSDEVSIKHKNNIFRCVIKLILIFFQELKTVAVGQTIDDKQNVYYFGASNGCNSNVNSNGALTIIITITVFRDKMGHYRVISQTRLCENMSVLLEDSTSSDLKIVTRDGRELAAHKIILKSKLNKC